MITVSEPVTCSRQASKSATSTNTCHLDCCGHGQRDKWLQQTWDFHGRQIGFSAIKSTCDPVKPRTWCFSATSGHFRRALRLHFSSWQKTSAQRLDIQQQHHITATFFVSPRDMVYDYRRHYSRRPEACYWWRRRSRWIWSHGEDYVKIIWYRFKI